MLAYRRRVVLNLLNDLKRLSVHSPVYLPRPSVIRYISDRIMVMHKGNDRWAVGNNEDKFIRILNGLYQKELIAAIPGNLLPVVRL